jgi:hypothetical protein
MLQKRGWPRRWRRSLRDCGFELLQPRSSITSPATSRSQRMQFRSTATVLICFCWNSLIIEMPIGCSTPRIHRAPSYDCCSGDGTVKQGPCSHPSASRSSSPSRTYCTCLVATNDARSDGLIVPHLRCHATHL